MVACLECMIYYYLFIIMYDLLLLPPDIISVTNKLGYNFSRSLSLGPRNTDGM
jgi:hypothetical protein